MSLPYPYYPCWAPEYERDLRRPVTVVIVVVIIIGAALAGWTPPEILRLLSLLYLGS